MRLIIGNVQSPANPLMRAVYLLVGAVALVAAFFFGAIILAVVIGLFVILAAVGAARLWWMQRRFTKAGGDPRQAHNVFIETDFSAVRGSKASEGRVIEGEFSEIRDNSGRKRPHDDG